MTEHNKVTGQDLKVSSQRLDIAMAVAGIKTDEDLAKRAGIDKRTLWNARKLGVVSFGVLARVAAVLKCNPIDLLETPGFPDPKWEALAALST